MTRLLVTCLVMAAWMVAACWAAAAVDGKSSPLNSAVEPDAAKAVEKKEREGHALRSDSASYASYLTAPAPAPVQPARPIPQPVHSPSGTTMGYVYYYLPTVQKYYPKLRDLIPYFRRLTPAASRAWPMVQQAADRTFDLGAAFALVFLAPALLISSVLFLVFIVFLMAFPAVSAFGKRRSGRDLSGLDDPDQVFDFDQFLPPEQSRKLATLAAQVDGYLEAYKRAFKSESCLEKFSCEAGQMSLGRLGKFVTEPVIA